jgi:hypothetical protein
MNGDRDLFPGLEEHLAQQSQAAEAKFEQDVLTKLLTEFFAEEAGRIKAFAGGEFGFDWFNNSYDCPVKLHARRLRGVAFKQLLGARQLPSSELWDKYFDAKAEHPPETPVGMIFRLGVKKVWVIHNHSMPFAPGFNIVYRQSASDDKALRIEPLEAFIIALKRVWTP